MTVNFSCFFTGDEREPVNACVGPIEKPQAVGARGDGLHGIGRQVGEHHVTQPAHHRLLCVRLVAQLSLSVELLVLNNQGQISHAQSQIQCLGQAALVVVVHQEKARQTVVCLLRGQPVRMRVVPVRAAAVSHREVVPVAATWSDGACRMPVHGGGRVQAVPVDDGRLRQRVVQAGRKARPALDAQDGILVGLARVLGLVQQKRRRNWRFGAGQDRKTRRGGANLQRPDDIEHAERTAATRHEKRLLEVGSVDGIKGVVAKWHCGHFLAVTRTGIHPGGHSGELKQLSSLQHRAFLF